MQKVLYPAGRKIVLLHDINIVNRGFPRGRPRENSGHSLNETGDINFYRIRVTGIIVIVFCEKLVDSVICTAL